jgi:hypothetical protein
METEGRAKRPRSPALLTPVSCANESELLPSVLSQLRVSVIELEPPGRAAAVHAARWAAIRDLELPNPYVVACTCWLVSPAMAQVAKPGSSCDRLPVRGARPETLGA